MMVRLNGSRGSCFIRSGSMRCCPAIIGCAIAGVLDLSWVHAELAPYYSRLARPPIDAVIRMLILGYVLFAYQRLTPWRHKSADKVEGYIGEANRWGKSGLKGRGVVRDRP